MTSQGSRPTNPRHIELAALLAGVLLSAALTGCGREPVAVAEGAAVQESNVAQESAAEKGATDQASEAAQENKALQAINAPITPVVDALPSFLWSPTAQVADKAAFLEEYARLVHPVYNPGAGPLGASPDDPYVLNCTDGPVPGEDAGRAAWKEAGEKTQALIDEGACVRIYGHGIYAAHSWAADGKAFLQRPVHLRVDDKDYRYAEESHVPKDTALEIGHWFCCREDDGASIGLQVCENDELLLVRYEQQ